MTHLPLSKTLRLAPLALSLFLTGCAVGPDYQQPYQQPMVTMAESYLYADLSKEEKSMNDLDHQKQGIGQAGERWWYQFGDTTLNTMIEDVQHQNIPLKMAAERIKMANSYKSVVASFKVPTVNVGAGYVNYQLSQNDSLLGPALNPIGDSAPMLPPELGSATLLDNQHDGGFVGASIAWELDLFGRIDHQTNAAQIRVEQAQIYQSGLTTLLTADVIHNYLQYLGAQERMQLLEANIADQEETTERVKKVVRSGYGSDLDLAQAQAMMAATRSLMPQLEIAQQVHKQRLATLLGESLTQIDIRLAKSDRLPTIKGVVPVGLPSDLLTRRPDIQMAEREVAAINEDVAVAVANRYPKFFLTGAPGVSASSFDDLFSSDSFGWVGSAGISWNVFDGGRGEAMVELNEARLNNAVMGYQHAVDSAMTEVDSLLFAYGRSQENEQSIAQAVASSNLALKKARSLYNAGLIDYLSVLDAQRQQRAMEDRQLAARLQTAQVTVGVYKSLGGDWQTQ